MTLPPAPSGSARRDLPLLLGGAAVSTLGSGVTLLAVAIQLRPSGPGWVAAGMAAQFVPIVVLAAVSGQLVDRVGNRALLVASLTLQAAAVLLASTLGLRHSLGWLLIGALALMGAGASVTNPAVAALLPWVSGEQAATRAYGWYSALTQTGLLGGAALGGLLIGATSVRTALLLDAATFAVMAAAVGSMHTRRVLGHAAAAAGRARWTGFGLLRREPALRVAVVGLAAAIFASILVNVAEVFFILQDIGAGPAVYGLVTACWPAAGVVVGVAAGRLVGDRQLLAALAAAVAVMGLALLLAGAVVSVTSLVVAWIFGGAANAVQRVAMNGLIRSRIHDADRGRVFAAAGGIFQAANLLGLAAGASLVGLLGARSSLLAAGAATVLVGVVTWGRFRAALRP